MNPDAPVEALVDCAFAAASVSIDIVLFR